VKESSMWVPQVGILELIIRGVVVYVALLVLLRFIGKKHVGELSPFDLVVLLIISETVDGSLIGDDHSLIILGTCMLSRRPRSLQRFPRPTIGPSSA
jgi:uncharacterized membrane protein YcaP (DUF421 family)